MNLSNLGDIQVVRGRLTDALDSYRKSVAIFEARLGNEHPYVAVPLRAEGDVLVQLGRAAEAVPLLERVLAMTIATKSAPTDVGQARFSLAKALAADPSQREHARALATTALGELGKGRDAEAVRAWLAAH